MIRRADLTRHHALAVVVHAGLTVIANFLAFWLRFDGDIAAAYRVVWLGTLPLLVLLRVVSFAPFGLYSGIWRYTGVRDLRDIISGVACSTLLFFVIVHYGIGVVMYPRSVLVIDAVLLVSFLGGVRLLPRVAREWRRPGGEKRVLVYGAGDAGETIVREMLRGVEHGYEPIGFVDDDDAKVGRRIHGIPVMGTRGDLPRIMATARPTEVLIALPRAGAETLRRIVRALEPFKAPIKTLPTMRERLTGRVEVSQIRSLVVEDLLGREPVRLEDGPVRDLVVGRRVLVTGAGGSIGSELCRQVLRLGPSELVLYERYENAMWSVENGLRALRPAPPIHAVIGDVTDARHVGEVLRRYRPDILFHAAAHKHVPLMEANPCEAIKNNVGGTRVVAAAAVRYGVGRFILISSDKAVNPSSVMGASKRVCELLTQAMARRGRTSFTAVRFGNVLDSNGSVVPRFLEQIASGGPVTVTHPDMRRYFMLIPEAVQLVLHAAALGGDGVIYVLEMGEQVRIVDLARNLIRLAGLVPEEEIAISFIGLRPGEKLFEELVAADEVVGPSAVDSIRRIRVDRRLDSEALLGQVRWLESLAHRGDAPAMMAHLRRLAPTCVAPDPGQHGIGGESSPVPSRQGLAALRLATT